MFKKFLKWYEGIYTAGKTRPSYSAQGGYKPTVMQKLKATLLLMVTIMLGIVAFFTLAAFLVSLLGPFVLFILIGLIWTGFLVWNIMLG